MPKILLSSGPRCSCCHGRAVRAARSRNAVIEGERVSFLAYVWSCAICGKQWCDDALELVNAKAAGLARSLAQALAEKQLSP